MKNLFYLLSVFGLITILSCGGDDCTSDSFVGVFSGELDCPNQDPASGRLTITRVSETIIKVVDNNNVEFDLGVDGCTATATSNFFGVEVTHTLKLDGDKLSYKVDNFTQGITITCIATLARQ